MSAALTVERLLGNPGVGFSHSGSSGGHHVNGGRMTMSPDTSDNASESSVTSDVSTGGGLGLGLQHSPIIPNAHGNVNHPLPHHPHRISPSRYSKIHLLLGHGNSDGEEEEEKFTGARAPATKGFELRIHSHSSPEKEQPPGVSDVNEIENRIKKEVADTDDAGLVIVEPGSDNNNGETSVPLLSPQTQTVPKFAIAIPESPSPRLIEDSVSVSSSVDENNGMDSGDDDQKDSSSPIALTLIRGPGSVPPGPPSRPSSSISLSSETSSTISHRSRSFISSPSPPKITQPQQQHYSHKFSISDILRPDFGQNAIQRIHERLLQHGRDRVNNNNTKTDKTRAPATTATAAIPKSEKNPIKNHSEDSNSSCSTSTSMGRREREVVDESKVNPSVPKGPLLWPAWVYCTRYSDRPSSGPRSRRIRKPDGGGPVEQPEEKRPRTAFTAEQLGRLKHEFEENRYLTEKRRQDLARELKLHENQIKIWFQNKRAKLKKSNGQRGGLALQLMAQGLYNHSTVPMDEDDDYIP